LRFPGGGQADRGKCDFGHGKRCTISLLCKERRKETGPDIPYSIKVAVGKGEGGLLRKKRRGKAREKGGDPKKKINLVKEEEIHNRPLALSEKNCRAVRASPPSPKGENQKGKPLETGRQRKKEGGRGGVTRKWTEQMDTTKKTSTGSVRLRTW